MRGGWPGLLVAGICFILPAAVMVCGLAWAYVRFGNLPATSALLYGIKPLVIAVILQALCGLVKTAVKTPVLAGIGLASSAALIFFGLHPLVLLLIAGTITVTLSEITDRRDRTQAASLASLLLPPKASPTVASLATAATAGTAAVVAPFTLGSLFLVFLKVGILSFTEAGLPTCNWRTRLPWARSRPGRSSLPQPLLVTFSAVCAGPLSRQLVFFFQRSCWLQPVVHWCHEFENQKLPQPFWTASMWPLWL
jgi:chromate transport protein ChrA